MHRSYDLQTINACRIKSYYKASYSGMIIGRSKISSFPVGDRKRKSPPSIEN